MQINSNNGFKPIKIALSIAAGSFLLYGDANNSSDIETVLSDFAAQEYISSIEDKSDMALFSRIRFNNLYESWRRETMFLSSADAIMSNANFQEIVSMGKDAVPYILDRIDKEPSSLVWALNVIFSSKISQNPRITVSEACKLWIKKLNYRR